MGSADFGAIELKTHASISELEQHWPSLVTDETPPFLSYAWLRALETTGCVSAARGWLPLFISLWQGERLVAAAPAYVKGHSMGEFVFDQSWAEFAERSLGVSYYPKLVVTVPFTPATGPRLLLAAEQARCGLSERDTNAAFADGLLRVAEHFELSGAHVLFVPEASAAAMTEFGFDQRYGVQFHWRNAGYASFEDFLERFPSKKRTQLRRERKEIALQGLEIEALTGNDLTSELVDHVFTFYKNTVERFYWGRQYLNREFFEEVMTTMPEQLHVVFARRKGTREPVAGAFNLLGKRTLYGRYWGAREDHRFLHFNVCFYAGISECIARELAVFEPGAGGEHKLARGFEPALTRSVHRLRHPQLAKAVAEYLTRERHAIGLEIEEAERNSLLRPQNGTSKICD
ncbi:MAG TPA: GNAT family N-acetyltransferase [Polyangiaceae bacterium]|nr:GNAT family N-acetyltransferase [Polyangiaceae bacterium]